MDLLTLSAVVLVALVAGVSGVRAVFWLSDRLGKRAEQVLGGL